MLNKSGHRVGFGEPVSFGPGSTCPPLYCPGKEERMVVNDYTDDLPDEVARRGFKLLSFEPFQGRDPYVLFDADGKAIAEWQRRPSWFELMDFARRS